MGGGGRQLYCNFLKFPPQRERDRTSTHYQKLYYSVLPRIATALELGKVLMYVCSIIIVDILPLSSVVNCKRSSVDYLSFFLALYDVLLIFFLSLLSKKCYQIGLLLFSCANSFTLFIL